ncbi:MAG: cyclase [Chloroflexi bacterium 13_1_20CM_2_70_9]|nr:MAG: cyclase [Chloroflexi bacterium 13_1_20CM_2_70_9]TMF67607.1 MAG: SRPBCC family protein [Chloroflexota bacterium]
MPKLKKSIEVAVPVRVAYDQWTQFEEFPRFMEGVESVKQLDDRRLRWRANVAGKVEEWDAEIVEQTPDRVISWRSTSGARNEGIVLFTPLDSGKTKIELDLHWEPKDVTERVGDVLGAEDMRVQGDLQRFKDFVEKRGAPTGAWRGEIHGERVEADEEAGTGSRG